MLLAPDLKKCECAPPCRVEIRVVKDNMTLCREFELHALQVSDEPHNLAAVTIDPVKSDFVTP